MELRDQLLPFALKAASVPRVYVVPPKLTVKPPPASLASKVPLIVIEVSVVLKTLEVPASVVIVLIVGVVGGVVSDAFATNIVLELEL